MEDSPEPRKLIRIEVKKLLGRFDHDLSFDPQWRFLIIHGPNGVGKTRLLELVNSAFNGNYRRLAIIPFKSAQFYFDDGTKIKVSRESDHVTEQSALQVRSLFSDTTDPAMPLRWEGRTSDGSTISHEVNHQKPINEYGLLSWIEATYDVEHADVDTWLDFSTREVLSTEGIIDRYGLHARDQKRSDTIPKKIRGILEEHEVHLIETQRLLNSNGRAIRRERTKQRGHEQPTVISYAKDLSRRLDKALADNSRQSQDLDRSLPSRLFQKVPDTEPERVLRSRYAEQNRLRTRLANVSLISVLDGSADLKLPDRKLNDLECRVLQTYLDDADEKLETFQRLLERLELMREIVNERFLFKRLYFHRQSGFVFKDEDTESPVKLQHLSSGEQHEIILMYELLMKVKKHSLVLIDEPEISLHVAWQQAFLDDLNRIAELTSLRFIIATHSPQIVGNWWDNAVTLYEPSKTKTRQSLSDA